MAKQKARFSELCPRAWAVTFGVLFGADAFLQGALNTLGMSLAWWNREILNLYASFYPGLSASWGGAFMGLLWGVIVGAIFGWLIAVIHNWALCRWGCR